MVAKSITPMFQNEKISRGLFVVECAALIPAVGFLLVVSVTLLTAVAGSLAQKLSTRPACSDCLHSSCAPGHSA